jgi:hypothetical protein
LAKAVAGNGSRTVDLQACVVGDTWARFPTTKKCTYRAGWEWFRRLFVDEFSDSVSREDFAFEGFQLEDALPSACPSASAVPAALAASGPVVLDGLAPPAASSLAAPRPRASDDGLVPPAAPPSSAAPPVPRQFAEWPNLKLCRGVQGTAPHEARLLSKSTEAAAASATVASVVLPVPRGLPLQGRLRPQLPLLLPSLPLAPAPSEPPCLRPLLSHRLVRAAGCRRRVGRGTGWWDGTCSNIASTRVLKKQALLTQITSVRAGPAKTYLRAALAHTNGVCTQGGLKQTVCESMSLPIVGVHRCACK